MALLAFTNFQKISKEIVALEALQMENELSTVYLARHGETAWSLSGQHTGRADLPLTPNGERNATRISELKAR